MADLNALIAQGVQFKAPPDPFAQYAQMQQLQQGEQANRLAQYQLGAAQRADVQSNALNQAYQSNMNPDTGEINYPGVYKSLAGSGAGASIPGVQQQQFKSSKEKAELAEILGRVAAQPVALAKATLEAVDVAQKQSRDRLNRIDPYSPDAGQQLFAWHQSNHAPGILGDTLRANGSTTEQSQQEIANAVNKGPQAIADFIARSSAGQQEFAKMIAPIPKRVTNGQISFVVDENPKSPTFGQKIGGEGFAMKMTPAEVASNVIAQKRLTQEGQGVTYQTDVASGNIVALPSRLAPGATPTASSVVAPGGGLLKAKPSEQAAVSEQQAAYNIGRLLTAANQIKDITGKDPSSMKPGATEALASSVGMSGTANLARPANRQIVQGAQRDALDALLYLATGAAYNKEQLLGQMEAYIPAFTDAKETVAAKQTRMADLIQSAKARAGKAWTPQMDAAMKTLMSPSKASGKVTPAAAAAPPGVDAAIWNVMTPEERKLWQK